MKKGGRPKKDIIKDKGLYIKITDSEKNQIKNIFEASSYNSISKMILDIVINNKYETYSTDQSMYEKRTELLNESRRIGNNFNQLLKHFNQKKDTIFTEGDIKNIIKSLDEIKNIYENINKNFKE